MVKSVFIAFANGDVGFVVGKDNVTKIYCGREDSRVTVYFDDGSMTVFVGYSFHYNYSKEVVQ